MSKRIIGIFSSLILISFIANAQTAISGYVYDSNGKIAEGVSLQLIEFKYPAISDENGYYQFKNVPSGQYRLLISHVGLKSLETPIVVNGEKNITHNFTLKENTAQLEAVIIRSVPRINNADLSIGKSDIKPMDNPQSITIISSSTIKQQQSQKLSDVVKNVNGVYLNSTRGSANETFSARGYSFSSTNMFKNGARINTGSLPEMSGIEKIEILKGSAALLYGNVSPGGILNMVTKQPKFKQGGEVGIRTGSWNLIKPMIDFYGPISNQFAYRVNGTYEHSNSFRDVVESQKFYVNPSMIFKPGKKTEILVQGDYLKTNSTPDFGIGSRADTLLSGLANNIFLGTNWQYNKVQQSSANIQAKHKLNNNWKLMSIIGYQKYNRDYYSIERIQAKYDGTWARPLNKILQDENYWNAEMNVNGIFNTGKIGHNLLVGIDGDKNTNTAWSFDQPTIYDTINILDATKYSPRTDIPQANKIKRVTTPTNRYGIYVQDLISILPNLKLLAGLRYSIQDAKSASTLNLLTNTTTKTDDKKDDAFSPRAGIVYQTTKSISIFSSYSNSFVINSGTDVFGNALKPSIVDQYEVGIKNELFNKLVSVNFTAYIINNKNLAQTAQFAADGITPNNNTSMKELVGETKSKGLELDIMGQPIKGLNLIAGMSLNDMRYIKTPIGKGNYIVGDRLVNIPKTTANFSANYDLSNAVLKGLSAGIGVFYTGKRLAGWNNTQQQTQNFSRTIPISSNTTADFYLGYKVQHFNLQFKVENLTNSHNYIVHENYSVNPTTPRSFTATAFYNF